MFLHPQSCSVCCVGYGDSGGVSPGKGQTGVPPRPCMPFTMPTWDLTEPVLSEVVSVLCVLVIPRCIDFRIGILGYCWGTGDLWHSRKEIPWCLRLVGSHGSQQFRASVWGHVVTETGEFEWVPWTCWHHSLQGLCGSSRVVLLQAAGSGGRVRSGKVRQECYPIPHPLCRGLSQCGSAAFLKGKKQDFETYGNSRLARAKCKEGNFLC